MSINFSEVSVTYFYRLHLTGNSNKNFFFMNLEKVVSSAKRNKYILISEADLHELLSKSELILEENTYISDKIRLLKYNNELLIQEKSTKEEFLVRVMKTQKEAEDFIKDRLDVYNRMWDGCGCKVKYYD